MPPDLSSMTFDLPSAEVDIVENLQEEMGGWRTVTFVYG
jgi:hypothetical protein